MVLFAYYDPYNEVVRLTYVRQPQPEPGILLGWLMTPNAECTHQIGKTWLTYRLNQLGYRPLSLTIVNLPQ